MSFPDIEALNLKYVFSFIILPYLLIPPFQMAMNENAFFEVKYY